MIVEGEVVRGHVIEMKRPSFPGVVVRADCPKCGVETKEDLSALGYLLTYPKIGVPEDLPLYCEGCNDHFEVKIVIDIIIRSGENDGPRDIAEDGLRGMAGDE